MPLIFELAATDSFQELTTDATRWGPPSRSRWPVDRRDLAPGALRRSACAVVRPPSGDPRPGALPGLVGAQARRIRGSKPLEKWRWTLAGQLRRVLAGIDGAPGREHGTKAMIKLLQLGSRHGYDRLRSTIESGALSNTNRRQRKSVLNRLHGAAGVLAWPAAFTCGVAVSTIALGRSSAAAPRGWLTSRRAQAPELAGSNTAWHVGPDEGALWAQGIGRRSNRALDPGT